MSKIFSNDNDVDEYIDEFLEKLTYRPMMIYVIMRCGYTENELNKTRYQLEILEHDNYYDEYAWDNDWYEGQQFIEIARIITDDDILTAFGYN